MHADVLSAPEISRRLKTHVRAPDDPEEPLSGLSGAPKSAAVLLPLFLEHNRWNLLFIRRAVNTLDRHSGEVAFPGGSVEPDDLEPIDTALREAREEIGLSADAVDILGTLPRFLTSSNFMVTPVVGQIRWPATLRPDPAEVAHIFSMPLDWMAEPRNHEVRHWQPPGRNRSRQVIFFREYEGERLWGVSARITLSLIHCLHVNSYG